MQALRLLFPPSHAPAQAYSRFWSGPHDKPYSNSYAGALGIFDKSSHDFSRHSSHSRIERIRGISGLATPQ